MDMRLARGIPLLLAALPMLFAFVEERPAAYAEEIGGPVPGLSEDDEAAFVRGRRLFRWKLWSPSRGAEGFNSTECTECHLEPDFGGTTKDKDLFVAMLPDESDPSGMRMYPRFELAPGRRPIRREYPPDAELRRPPALFGLGLLEAVPEAELLKRADPEDKNKDGISGRLIPVEGGPGRFGWKSTVSTVERFVITAFKGELGMRPEAIDQPDFTRLGPNQLKAITQYIRLLGAPKPGALSAEAKVGRALFEKTGCASCHVPSLETDGKAIPQLRNKRVEAYTDLLLHDLGPGPAQAPNGTKPGPREYRTAPLWGLGKIGGPFLHDGSAATLAEAIKRHEGEATASRDRLSKLSKAQQNTVEAFLKSL